MAEWPQKRKERQCKLMKGISLWQNGRRSARKGVSERRFCGVRLTTPQLIAHKPCPIDLQALQCTERLATRPVQAPHPTRLHSTHSLLRCTLLLFVDDCHARAMLGPLSPNSTVPGPRDRGAFLRPAAFRAARSDLGTRRLPGAQRDEVGGESLGLVRPAPEPPALRAAAASPHTYDTHNTSQHTQHINSYTNTHASTQHTYHLDSRTPSSRATSRCPSALEPGAHARLFSR